MPRMSPHRPVAPALRVARPLAFLAALAPAALRAQAVERVTLGDDAAVYDPAGRVRVIAGEGSDVVVEVTRGGRDGARLRLHRPDGRTLAVVAPEGELVYPSLGRWSSTSFDVREDGTFGSDRGWGSSRRLTIRGGGGGPEAWADMVVRVPRGRRLTLHLGVGAVTATNVAGDLTLNGHAGDVTAEGTRGRLAVGTGSGRVRVRDVQGDEIKVGTGSGGAEVGQVRAGRLTVGAGSGDVRGADIEADQAKLGTGSGDVRLARMRARSLEAGSGSGRLELELGAGLEDARLSTGSGGVTLRVPSSFGATFDVRTGSGGIRTGIPVQVSRQSRGTFQGSVGDGRARVRVSAGSGEVRIEPAG